MNNPNIVTVYKVNTPLFEGPLDLLLQLIERAELDITDSAIAQVTDQYLEYIENIQEISADHVSEFLVIAARLLQIKSEALLPRPPVRLPGEDDPGESLARQLIIYRRYKQIAEILGARQQEHLRSFLRLASLPVSAGHVDLSGIGLGNLVDAAQYVQSRIPVPQTALASVISPPKITIRKKIRVIAELIGKNKNYYFFSLIKEASTRLEIVVAFLAVLELVRLRLINVSQENIFSDIYIESEGIWQEGEEFELEFGE